MQNFKNWILPVLIFAIIIFVFRAWFSFLPLSTGDWQYKFPEQISSFHFFPSAWKNDFNNGLGSNGIFLMPLDTYFMITTGFLFKYLHIPWVIIEKVVWFWMFILISVIGSFLFFKRFFLKNNTFASLSSLIFTTNTYALMITGGGQIGIGMAYAMIPIVFYSLFSILEKALESKKTKIYVILGAIFFSFQLIIDLRIAYITVIFFAIYYLLFVLTSNFNYFKKTFIFLCEFVILAFLLNFFWIVPFALSGQNPLNELGIQYSTSGIVGFLSFAKFENTISLIHPNWPENLFGKAYFMKPEFLLLPILAFSTLFFLEEYKKKKTILILSTFLILAAFLAKGTNDPFGTIYTLAFNKVPGFSMFRDPTKWYSMIALSFSILVPVGIFSLSNLIENRIQIKLNYKNLLVLIFVIFWIITIRQAIFGRLGGTFSPASPPKSYVQLKDFIANQNIFFRTLWVPQFHQYSFFSDQHPEISAGDYLLAYSAPEIASKIEKNLEKIRNDGIKYIIIPEDTQGKIFTNDRKYDENKYQETVNDIRKIKNLKEVKSFGKIIVFEVLGPNREQFFSFSKNLQIINENFMNPSKYLVIVQNANPQDTLVFSEKFDSKWVAKISSTEIRSSNLGNLNGFSLPLNGEYEIYYKPQSWVNLGLIVSAISLLGIIIYLIRIK